ncbi:hypothetical protein TRIUR3_18109 [Triticum urartu]|uniref:Methyltransferase type 11 domain-containing protein n=1 Tax=Triticum urartu TaxID=4572 RepID=M7ZBC0_TRIUA|nr:hypothetical protein TRIUR3_18109 [Triticum urartu]
MANLFLKQAKHYAAARPDYPAELFQFIASKTARHDLAWDVGTGSGQAAVSLAKLYKKVVGTDTSAQQLAYAPALPNPHWAPNRKMVDDEYRSADFPFDPVDGETHTGPFEFSTQRRMDLDDYFTYIKSWSAYQTAKDNGVELLDAATVQEFADAWGGDREEVKTVRYPIFLRIGKVRP